MVGEKKWWIPESGKGKEVRLLEDSGPLFDHVKSWCGLLYLWGIGSLPHRHTTMKGKGQNNGKDQPGNPE